MRAREHLAAISWMVATAVAGCGGETDPPAATLDGGTFGRLDASAADAGERLDAAGPELDAGDASGSDLDGGSRARDAGPRDRDGGRTDAAAWDAGGCGATTAFALTPIAAPALAAAVSDFDRDCRSGYTWCGGALAGTWEAPVCSRPPATITEVVDSVLLATGDRATFVDGRVLTASELGALFFFSPGHSASARDLRAAVDAFIGGTFEAWYYDAPVPCHNCTENGAILILWSPVTRQIAAITGTYGYDS
jgi:hypothetical protein